jgi:hypothetical protein
MAKQTPNAAVTPAANLIRAIVLFDAILERAVYFICLTLGRPPG